MFQFYKILASNWLIFTREEHSLKSMFFYFENKNERFLRIILMIDMHNVLSTLFLPYFRARLVLHQSASH